MSLKDRTLFITGASRGIGLAIALRAPPTAPISQSRGAELEGELKGVSQARTPAARRSSGQPLISLRRRVFAAGLLGVHTFRSALLVLQASDARPGALEIVAHCDVQRAAALAG
jgi:hypothetical protein